LSNLAVRCVLGANLNTRFNDLSSRNGRKLANEKVTRPGQVC
jgi:hypothetical protein